MRTFSIFVVAGVIRGESYLICVVTAENLRTFLFKFQCGLDSEGQLVRNLSKESKHRKHASSEKLSDIVTKPMIEEIFTALTGKVQCTVGVSSIQAHVKH